MWVPENESILYVPLRSNAKTLVTGKPIAAVRRRLKYASVFNDQVFLESGVSRMQAGEGGSSSFVIPADEDHHARPNCWRSRSAKCCPRSASSAAGTTLRKAGKITVENPRNSATDGRTTRRSCRLNLPDSSPATGWLSGLRDGSRPFRPRAAEVRTSCPE